MIKVTEVTLIVILKIILIVINLGYREVKTRICPKVPDL
jgi:hypothetical protein